MGCFLPHRHQVDKKCRLDPFSQSYGVMTRKRRVGWHVVSLSFDLVLFSRFQSFFGNIKNDWERVVGGGFVKSEWFFFL